MSDRFGGRFNREGLKSILLLMKKNSQKVDQRIDLEFVDFIREFFTYLFKRVRLFVVVFSVSLVVLEEWISELKRFVIRYMFLGRVKGYRFVVGSFVSLLLLLLPFILSRDPITMETYAEENVYETFAQKDLLIEQGSSQTLIPKSRTRMDVISYTVQGGDTLGTIAEDFGLMPVEHGIETLKWANDLTSAHLIQPGVVLKIPPGNGVFHKVKSGDTLSSVAKKYDAAEQAIADINWLDAPFSLKEGTVVFVPDGTMPPPPKPVVATTPVPSYSSGGSSGGGASSTPSPPSSTRFVGWPVIGGRGSITQCYSGWHNGVDIADAGWPDLVAAASGTVTFAGCQSGSCPPPGSSIGGYGLAWTVVIDHGNGYSTTYGHLNRIYVHSGQSVSAGQSIAQMGRSGTATGVHVHFMVHYSGTWTHLNPAPFMSTHICGY